MVNVSLSDSFFTWRKGTLQPWLLFFSPLQLIHTQTNSKWYLTNLFSAIWSRKHTKDENINLEHDWSFVNKSVFWLLCRWLFSPRKQSLTKGSWPAYEYVLQRQSGLCVPAGLSVPHLFQDLHVRRISKTPWFPPALLFNCSSELPTSSGMSCSLLRHPRWGAEDCREKDEI